MFVLRNLTSNETHELGTRSVIGRSRAADLHIAEDGVSGEHATIWWDGEIWNLRDLGSRNGTLVDDNRVAGGGTVSLSSGQRLQFGGISAWLITDATPPVPSAQALMGGHWVRAEDGLLVLPSPDNPILTLYSDIDGAWQMEGPDLYRVVHDLELVAADGKVWRLHLPVETQGTVSRVMRPTLEGLAWEFRVSRDEEHVELAASGMGSRIDLKARAHNYTLVVLARARLEESHLPEGSQGWIYQDELCKMLGIDDAKLNLFVFRARKQLSAMGVEGSAGIVERRVGTRQLRLGVSDITITAL
jgi:hypothetical protein